MRTASSSCTWSDVLNAAKFLASAQGMVECFEHNNIPGILQYLDEQVSWHQAGNSALIPFAGRFTGLSGAMTYFERVGHSIRVSRLNTSNFQISGHEVSADIHVEGTALPGGKPFALQVSVTWTFNAKGRVSQLDHKGDLSALEEAFRH